MKKWKAAASLLTLVALLMVAVPAFAEEEIRIPWTGDPDPYACNDFFDCFNRVKVCIAGVTHEVGIYYDPATQTAEYMEADALLWSDIVLTIGACSTTSLPRCPTCGPPVWESASGPQGDGMAMAWTSIAPCSFNMADWCFDLDSKVRAWSTIAFSFEYPADVFHVAEEVSGTDGVTYYVLDVDDHDANNAIIWGPDGQGDRFRDHGPVYKYLACSIAPGYYDAPDGVAIYKVGHTVSDWAKFLLDNDFFADEQFRGDASLEWANTLHDAGELALP